MLAAYDSFKWMGCVICAVAMFGVAPIYFPMWGGLICGPKAGATEEDYYFSEYTPAEREQGHHLASSKFVSPCPLPSMAFAGCCAPALGHASMQRHAIMQGQAQLVMWKVATASISPDY